jgi:hypothetical protein
MAIDFLTKISFHFYKEVCSFHQLAVSSTSQFLN